MGTLRDDHRGCCSGARPYWRAYPLEGTILPLQFSAIVDQRLSWGVNTNVFSRGPCTLVLLLYLYVFQYIDTTIACPIELGSRHYLRNGLADVGRVTGEVVHYEQPEPMRL